MTTLTKLTTKELAVLRALDSSEYGSFLTDAVWSFTIADNSDLTPKSIPGICASLQKKGYTRHGESDGQKTIEMTKEGALAYIAANGGGSHKHVDSEAFEAAGKVAAETIVATDEAEVAAVETKKEAKKVRAAARRKLALIAELIDAPVIDDLELVAAIRKLLAK
jgi:DNA-binding MarR family transcriptional regulator